MEALKVFCERQDCGSYYAPQQPHGLTITTTAPEEPANDPVDAGGAQSGKSETLNEALLLDPAAAAAMTAPDVLAAAGTAAAPEPEAPGLQPATASLQLAELCPLDSPDDSEGPEAAAEYEVYLQRWEAGETLAQRWHRLAQSGKLDDIRADWEDWQLDMMLTQVKARTQQALSQAGKAAAGAGLLCSTRLRRGRGEVEEAADSPNEEPRRVRSRRAPSTLQDYHVDNGPATGGPLHKTPDRTPEAVDAAAAAAVAPGQPGSYRQQLLPPQPAADPASEESTDEADHVTARLSQQQLQHMHYTQQQQQQQPQQQQPQQRPPGRRGPLPQQPPKRVVTRVQRSTAAPQQAASRQMNRVITPYNPQLHQHMMAQQQVQQQQMMVAMQQDQQQQLLAGVSPEMLEEFYKMGSRLGAAFNHAEGDSAAGLAQNPAAMAAFMHTLYQYGANPAAFAQQVSSVTGPQHQ